MRLTNHEIEVLLVGGVVAGVVLLAGSIAWFCYELRHAPLIDTEASKRGQAALARAKQTATPADPVPADDEIDRRIRHAAWLTREDPPLSHGWGPLDWSAYVDEYADDWVRLWTAEQEGR